MLDSLNPAAALETEAERILLLDLETGTSLIARDTDAAFAPGNFAKLVTAAVVFEAIEAGELTLDTRFPVTEHAWRTGGAPARVTTMFAPLKSQPSVADLLQGLVVQYANDAAIILAEGIAGDEAGFTTRMNALAGKIGLTHSRFVNPTGLPQDGATTSIADLVRLAAWIRDTHPELAALYGQPEFTFNKIRQLNKSTHLRDLPGSDGMMLAFDEAAGFGALVTAERDGRRIVLAMNGLKGEEQRRRDIKALVEQAFTAYTPARLFDARHSVGSVRVYGGAAARLAVEPVEGVSATIPAGDRSGLSARIVYDGPVIAPIAAGTPVAELEIRDADTVIRRVPLVASTDVPLGSLSSRARDAVVESLVGWW
ncbi:D-alanyl-D-alanine carboxypeptidase family protein [Methylobrevis albus]|uniref:serine-type D-Ala-D-Ala carboxypeptidase n=1 Tax=Methylobrevis albus TaxID=2793297 RepID=A0A931I2S0_9HYPH|nr:D-alanyl-D-alanine carboxypeptidase family protein [Methylobrevis albus]MBH0239175.1 D-alanyl-D-alanine carboxypeptidase [Methylobrevis albus]